MPASWETRRIAGKDWFGKSNPDLTLCKPEACSLLRATSFNRHNVEMFYNNLDEVMKIVLDLVMVLDYFVLMKSINLIKLQVVNEVPLRQYAAQFLPQVIPCTRHWFFFGKISKHSC